MRDGPHLPPMELPENVAEAVPAEVQEAITRINSYRAGFFAEELRELPISPSGRLQSASQAVHRRMGFLLFEQRLIAIGRR